jgi:hypothetical protein
MVRRSSFVAPLPPCQDQEGGFRREGEKLPDSAGHAAVPRVTNEDLTANVSIKFIG